MRLGKLKIILMALPLILAAVPCPAQSLGDIAREVRQQKKETRQPVKVFTNDNLPPPTPWEPVTMESTGPSAKSQAESKEKPATPTEKKEQESPAEKTEAKKENSEELEAQLKAAKQELSEAQEQQQLSEDELNLLELQQAREGSLDNELHAQLEEKIGSKTSEVEAKRAATAKAQDKVDDISKKLEELQGEKDAGSSEKAPDVQPPEQASESQPPAEGEQPASDAPADTQ